MADKRIGKKTTVASVNGGNRRLHVHVDNVGRLAPLFQVTPARLRAARRKYPDIARRLRFTLGTDLDGFDKAMKTAEVLVGWRLPWQELAQRAPKLRWLHLTGAGIEHLLPMDWIPRGLIVTNNRGVHAPKAGEFAAMAILMLNSAIPALVTSQQQGKWNQLFSTPVIGKTVLIVGVGEMGRAAAARAKALGLTVLGVRRSGMPARCVDEMYRPADLHRILPRADFVLVAAPLTPATRHLIDARALDRMKPGAGVINMGRAGVIDYGALASRLRRRRIAGAILDVFSPEPLPANSPLWHTPNLIITPHVSSDDEERYIPRTLDLVFDNLDRLMAGRRLRNRVRPNIGY